MPRQIKAFGCPRCGTRAAASGPAGFLCVGCDHRIPPRRCAQCKVADVVCCYVAVDGKISFACEAHRPSETPTTPVTSRGERKTLLQDFKKGYTPGGHGKRVIRKGEFPGQHL